MSSAQALRRGSNFCSSRQDSEKSWDGLSSDAAKTFDTIKLTMNYPSGAMLFIEGEGPKGIFVLSKGRVKLSLASANGKVLILRIAKPGEILGLHGVISNVGFQATAETVEPCQIDFVKREDFLRFLEEHPQAALLAAKQLSASYQETCHQLRSLGLSGCAREKVARFLLEWSEHGEQRKDGIRTRFTLTHEEIGQLIGASRETITRILGDFKEHHWIAIRGSMLLLEDKDAMEGLLGPEGLSSSAVHPLQNAEEGDGRLFQSPTAQPFVHPKAHFLDAGSSALHG